MVEERVIDLQRPRMFRRFMSLALLEVWLATSLVSVLGDSVPVGCGGFIRADFAVDFTKIKIQLYTAGGALRDTSDCAPNIGYYLIPFYDKGDYVLRVDAPRGWKTEPAEVKVSVDGETDLCSRGEDINFQLLGFSVLGQVTSEGLDSGPSGVTLELKQDDAIKYNIVTTEKGWFLFEGVPPGTYTLQASHPVWILSKSSTTVVVSDGTSEVSAGLIVLRGFDAMGRVANDGQPVPGVQFLLFSRTGKKIDCDVIDPLPREGGQKPSCVAVSDANGVFTFPCLPPGDYRLVPHYSQNGIEFEVNPTETEFKVSNDTITITPPFEVHGFSVSGQVLRTKEGRGVAGAKVYIDGEEVAVTDYHGNYQLLNITTGRYNVKINAPEALLEFSEVQVSLSPSNPNIPTIIASKYGVYGEVIITHPVSTTKSPRTVQVLTTSSPPVVVETVTVDTKAQFYTLLPLGSYNVKVVISEEERDGGLLVLPLEHPLDMREQPPSPATTLKFKQYLGTLTGAVNCLGPCPSNIRVVLVRSSTVPGQRGQELRAKLTVEGNKGTFSLADVLPGNVKVSVDYPQWCWKQESLSVEITNEEQSQLLFLQTGYSLQYSVSHTTTVTYAIGKEPQVETVLTGKGHLCVEKSGVYTVEPRSCHKFDKEVYAFDTSSPKPLVLESGQHYVNVSVYTEKKDPDLKLTVRSLRFGSPIQVLKPLLVAKQLTAEAQTRDWKYSFSFLAQPQDEVEVLPSSSELMFSPPKRVITVSKECPEEVSPFLGSPGLMVAGSMTPALEGVLITIATEQDGQLTTTTDNKGQYRAGPLRSGKALTVNAEKEGYAFEPLPSDPHSFTALKLSQIIIKVLSAEGSPLSRVLVSLSGANFRSNNFTSDDGTLRFNRLNPGQYFTKALLREYEFQPSSKVIDLAQGGSETISFTASRVAFSCSGRVTTLNKYPLEGVVVKASGSGEGQCGSLEIDTPTDSNGEYRLRGLMPGCNYQLTIELTEDIERSIPISRTISVSDWDIEGVEFVAMPTRKVVYITGNVITDHKHFPMLKAQLSRGSSVLSSVSVDVSGFFDFPPVPIQEEDYMVTLDSTLSPHSYRISHSEEAVPGNSDSHTRLVFTAEELTTVSDSQRGSIIALIIAVFIIFAIANIDKLYVFVQSVMSNSNGQRDNGSLENRRKTGRRR